MKIQINHIAKIEGHAGFTAEILKGNVLQAKIDTQDGARLIEGILIGRYFKDAPTITSRICGLCPVVHNLCSTKAIESALEIKVSDQTIKLRTIMELAQIVYSHALHFYFLTLPDFFDIENDIALIGKFPNETAMIFKMRDWSQKIQRAIGGRAVHPLAVDIGGFKNLPKKTDLQEILKESDEILNMAIKIADFFTRLKLPPFERQTEYIATTKEEEYAIYDGTITSSKGWKAEPKDFEKNIEELQIPYYMAKRVKHEFSSYMVGAIARINLSHQYLNPEAKKMLGKFNLTPPIYNTFANIFCQIVENIHAIEEIKKLTAEISVTELTSTNAPYKIKAGYGAAAVEAPRGTLYHAVRINDEGMVSDYNIITPTVQFLANLEDDIKKYLPDLKDLDDKTRNAKIRSLVRAYDPCITCATH